MKRMALLLLALSFSPALPLAAQEGFHRATQYHGRHTGCTYPANHRFSSSHVFTIIRPWQKSVHSFVRKGSVVSPDAKMFDLDRGTELKTHTVAGKDVNALGYYPTPTDPDSVVVQGDLEEAVEEGRSTRIRVQETYTDPVGYLVQNGELTWKRTLGRPLNYVTLPAGWMLTSVNTPASISLDSEGRVQLRFTNPRNDELSVEIKAKKKT